jgi:hypothetical protein
VSETAVPEAEAGRVFSRLARVARGEYGLFPQAVGAIGLHVLDDNFLQPQPGTSAGDDLVSGLELVGRIAPRPLVLIYTPHGQGVETNPAFYAAAGEPKTLWEIPEAGHTGGLEAHLQEYERRVIAFFDHALLEGK